MKTGYLELTLAKMSQQKQKTVVVTLKGAAPWISEVHYEKEEQDVKLFFTLRKETEVNVIVENEEVKYKRLVPLGALAQRLVSRVEYKPSSDLYFTFATKKDFQECQATQKSLMDSFAELQQHGSEDASLLVLFEQGEQSLLKGLLWSKNAQLRQKALFQHQGKEKGNWVLFETSGHLPLVKDSLKELL